MGELPRGEIDVYLEDDKVSFRAVLETSST